jgi:hypothetical protein
MSSGYGQHIAQPSLANGGVATVQTDKKRHTLLKGTQTAVAVTPQALAPTESNRLGLASKHLGLVKPCHLFTTNCYLLTAVHDSCRCQLLAPDCRAHT